MKVLVQHPPINEESLHSLAMAALADAIAEVLAERGHEAASVVDEAMSETAGGLRLVCSGIAAGEHRRIIRWSFGNIEPMETADEHLSIVMTPQQHVAGVAAKEAVALLELQGEGEARVSAPHDSLYVVRPDGREPLLLEPLRDAEAGVRGLPRMRMGAGGWLDLPRTAQELRGIVEASRNLLLEAGIDGSLDATAICLAVLARLVGCRVAVIGAPVESPYRPAGLPVLSTVRDVLSFLASRGEIAGDDDLPDSLLALLQAEAGGATPPRTVGGDNSLDHARFIAATLDDRLAESEAKRLDLVQRLGHIARDQDEAAQESELNEIAEYALALEQRLHRRERGMAGRLSGILRWFGQVLAALVTGRQPLEAGRLSRPVRLEKISASASHSTMRPSGLVGQPGGRARGWLRFLPPFVVARLRAALRTAKQQRPAVTRTHRRPYSDPDGFEAEYWRLQAMFALEELEHERGLRGSGPVNEEEA